MFMKRTLIALLLIAVGCLVGGQQAFVGPGVTPVPVGMVTSTATIPVTMFFVSNSGSDAANGLTISTPWQTVAKVNSSATIGSQVNFNGGQTFTTTTGITADVSVASYGTGQATISSGNSAPCVKNINPAGARSVNNVVCTGGGLLTNTTDAVVFSNTTSGNLPGPSITNATISGYGGNGVHILGSPSAACFGFTNTVVSNNTIHDVSGMVTTDTTGVGAINFAAHGCYGNGAQTPANIGAITNNNNIYNIPGVAGTTTWSGGGLSFAETSNITANGNTIRNIGSSNTHCGGASGLLVIDSANLTAQQNSMYDFDYASGGCDSNGFDISDNVTNILVQYNYIKNPGDHCFILTNYSDTQHAFANVTVRFNTCQNPKYKSTINFDIQVSATGPVNIYNNTIISQVPGKGIVFDNASTNTGSVTATIANNIFIGNAGNMLSVVVPSSINFYGNDYYTYGRGFNVSWNGTAYTSFAAWQTATGQEKISGSNVGLTSNPQIYVPGGGWNIPPSSTANQLYAYYLQSGSPMVGAGINLLSQFSINPGSQDFYGAAVSSASLPVGASAGDFSTFAASCTAATNYLARVSSFTKLDNVQANSLLCGEVDDGDFALLDGQWMLAAPNQAASLLNLISTNYSLTANGTITFTARSGTSFDGLTGYYDTGLTESTAGGNASQNAATLCAYDFTAIGTANAAAIAGGGAGEWALYPYDASNTAYADINSDGSGGMSPSGNTTPSGFSLAQRTGATASTFWKNGVKVVTDSATASTAMSSRSTYIGAYHSGSGPVSFLPDTLGMACAGGVVSPLRLSLRVNSFMAAYGVNVY
jgi:hypothetical protein